MKRLLVLALLCVAIPYAFAQSTFTITDLGALGGDTGSFPGGINNRGDVSATSVSPDDSIARAFLWRNGERTPLGALGGSMSVAIGINQADQVVGLATLPGDMVVHGFLWSKGVMEDLGTLGGDASVAYWINNRQQVVGMADTSVLNPLSGSFISHAFFDERGLMIDIGALGGYDSIATAINERGQVTGVSEITKVPDPDPKFGGAPPFHAFVWEDGMMTDLGGLLGGKFSWGIAIDNHGRVVGMANTAGDATAHAFVWAHGVARDLGTLDGDKVSWGYGINDKGQVVGTSAFEIDPGVPLQAFHCPCHAFIWENGRMKDLQKLIPPDSRVRLSQAIWINERGQVVAEGAIGNSRRTFLLTPKTTP